MFCIIFGPAGWTRGSDLRGTGKATISGRQLQVEKGGICRPYPRVRPSGQPGKNAGHGDITREWPVSYWS